ncbi:hypothetical protein FA15DRAFT_183853 [Coprinopsis marcescibilis]|uniref:Uncharacterized protein n=1 Tax=Coprinopsis marcescibilis TaxID=230819 RepID=A0A5C3LD65_COPMA|nr:hypothetical protein FA15DRAFT_183853 [Coprinopsis marcescibilis]
MSEPAAERDLTPSRTAGTSVPVHALAPSVPVGHSLPLEAKGYYNADVGDSRTLAPSNVPRQDSKNITHSDPRVSATPISRESPLPQTALDRIDAKPSPVQKLHVPPSVQSVQQVVNHSQVITQKGIDNFGVSPGVVRSIERRDQRETGDPIPRRETKVDLLTEFPGNSNRNVRQTDKPSNGSRGLGNGIPHGTGIQLNDSPKGYLESNIASQFQGRRPSISLEDSNRIVDRDKQMVIPVQPQHTVHINHPLDQPVVSAPHHIGHRQASSVYVPPPSARPSLLQLPAVTAETPENPQLALANNENPTATVPGSVRPALVSLPPSTSKQDGNERVRRLETHTLNERLDITEQTYASRAPDQVRTTLQMSAGTAVPSSTRPILLELPEITSSDQERFRQKVEDTRSGRSHALKPDFRYPSVSSIVPGSARPPPLPLPSDSKEEERDRASRYADRPPASAPPTNQRHAISSKQSEHQQATTQHRTAVSRQEDNPQLGRHKHSWSVPPNIGPSTRQASSHHRPVHSQVPGSTRNATVPLPSQPQEPQRNLHPQVPGSTRHATIPLPTSHSYDHRPTYQQVPSITRQATMPPPVQMPRQSSYEPDETILLTPSSLAPTSMLPSLSQQANPRSSENVLPANNLASGSHSPPEQQNKSNPANAPSISRATHRRPRVIDDRDVQPAIKRSPKRRPHQVGEYGHRSVPIHQSQEDPRSESKPFNPFRYLGSHGPRKRTMSMVSLEARDGTAPSTVVGSPDASMCSTAPFTLPPVQDPIAAAEKWRNSEEAKFKESTKTRRSRPGVVVQVPVDEDRDSLDENKPSRPRRLGRRKRPPTRPTQERA